MIMDKTVDSAPIYICNYHSILLSIVMIAKEQREAFLDQGYLVVPDVVPQVLCHGAIDAILDYTGVALDDQSSWYEGNYARHGIIPLHHHQAFWDIRQLPAIHRLFRDIYGTEKLWVSMDRASYNDFIAFLPPHLHDDLFVYDTDNDLRRWIDQWQNQWESLQLGTQALMSYVHKHHSYKNRAERIIEWAQEEEILLQD